MMTDPSLVTLRVDDVAHGGACVARQSDGRVVFVRHTLPGEHVVARITRTRSRLAWADAVDILEASADRVPSVWPEAGPGGVGGGELAHVRPAAQRAWKEQVIRTQIRRIGGPLLDEAVRAIGGITVQAAPGDEDPDDTLCGRRTRIELVASNEARLGMHVHHGHDLRVLEHMPLAVPALQDLNVLGAASPIWHGAWGPGERVRLVAPNGDDPLIVTPRGFFDRFGDVDDRDALRWDVTLATGVLQYQVRPQGFWQTHVEGASVLARAVVEGAQLRGGEQVMELYAGAGLFSQALAHHALVSGLKQVAIVTLEGDEAAVADAAANCRDLPGVDTWVGDVDAQGVKALARQGERMPDVVVLDPPRSGAGKDVVRAVAASGAKRVVLVSCDPAAGARDLAGFVGCGYRLETLWAWDLFPHTHHVESVAVLTRTSRSS
ncbi:class I SAM-dependent RNA methyltransferase [Schaalia suimastitidis]|uniref:class I SAM-dependent RNA methyltransferase n=1 Tax=Schaalia suimastitidis TaxID=121163 RepID=UPI0004077ABD|nr:TRAM domain-containing protein [Schaalia suimastitidis]